MTANDGARSPDGVAAELQKLLIVADGVESFLTEVSLYAAGAVEHAHSVGITVGATRAVQMMGATSGELAKALDATNEKLRGVAAQIVKQAATRRR